MKDGLTAQVLAEAGPTVVGTMLKHYLTGRKARKDGDDEDTARVEFVYDEAFNVAKMFLNVSTHHTADALQKFGQTRTPCPPWVAMHRLSIPQATSSLAAEYLIEALGGKEMAFKIAGGTTWWQVRAGPGVECEWIVLKQNAQRWNREDARRAKEYELKGSRPGTPLSNAHEVMGQPPNGEDAGDAPAAVEEDSGFIPEMDRTRCMLYIHGGGYYWGSINTHRYLIWRLAGKMNGRAFAVNYRKTPQYPFPCAIQDVLAAYIYLVNPPAGAPHRAVNPKNIVLVGDSAGGGLVWSLLQILRDTPGLELPAGAALISPWSDLTHSFPSILKNTKTDVLPPYSFIHKPSSLWPPPPPQLTESMKTRLMNRVRRGLGKHVDIEPPEDTPYPSLVPEHRDTNSEVVHTSDPEAFMKLKDFFNPGKDAEREPVPSAAHMTQASANPADIYSRLAEYTEERDPAASLASCDDSLVINARGMSVVIDTQIQLYARNSQLCHPFVSPVLGYLGGLPPIYVMAGNSEVLRDEIIYAAHKAAHPTEHPIREDVAQLLPSLVGIEGKHKPTDVHLQVYDGVGHDLPLFSMTKPARGAIRAIATFCQQVTPGPSADIPASVMSSTVDVTAERIPGLVESPNVIRPRSTDQNGAAAYVSDTVRLNKRLHELKMDDMVVTGTGRDEIVESPVSSSSASIASQQSQTSSLSDTDTIQAAPPELTRQANSFTSLSSFFRRPRIPPPRSDTVQSKAGPGEAGWPGVYAGTPYVDHMIRERVNFDGMCRPLEPESDLDAMTMPSTEIGMVKEGPALRYIEGQAIWDKKFRHTRKRIERHRRRNLHKARHHDAKTLSERWSKFRESESEVSSDEDPHTWQDRNADRIPLDGSWAWQWALGGEQPPPSAIVGRRDLPEGRKTALQADRIDTTDDSEMHALSIWVMLAQMFSSRSENKKATEAWKEAKAMHPKKIFQHT